MSEVCPHCQAPIPAEGTWYVCPACLKPLPMEKSRPILYSDGTEVPRGIAPPMSRMWPTFGLFLGVANVIVALFMAGQKKYGEALYLGLGAVVMLIVAYYWLIRLHQARLDFDELRKQPDFVALPRSFRPMIMALIAIGIVALLIALQAYRVFNPVAE